MSLVFRPAKKVKIIFCPLPRTAENTSVTNELLPRDSGRHRVGFGATTYFYAQKQRTAENAAQTGGSVREHTTVAEAPEGSAKAEYVTDTERPYQQCYAPSPRTDKIK